MPVSLKRGVRLAKGKNGTIYSFGESKVLKGRIETPILPSINVRCGSHSKSIINWRKTDETNRFKENHYGRSSGVGRCTGGHHWLRTAARTERSGATGASRQRRRGQGLQRRVRRRLLREP